MNRPDEIDANFDRAGATPIPLTIVGHSEDKEWPMHVWEPEVGWIVFTIHPEFN